MTTRVTPSSANRSASTSSQRVIVGEVRTSSRPLARAALARDPYTAGQLGLAHLQGRDSLDDLIVVVCLLQHPGLLGSDDRKVVARRSRRATGRSDPRARGDSEGPTGGSQHPAYQRPPTTKEIRRQRATTPIFIRERAPPQRGTAAYQQNAGNRCAEDRFCRSRPTVGAEVKCSH